MYKILIIILSLIIPGILFSQVDDKSNLILKNKTLSYGGRELKQGFMICRKIKDTPYFHYGVVYGTSTNGQRIVLHFDQKGVRYSKIEDFAQNQVVLVVFKNEVDISKKKDLLNNIWKKTTYDATKSNCEHFAYEICSGYRISPQYNATKKIINDYTPMLENYLIKVRPKDSTIIKSTISLTKQLL